MSDAGGPAGGANAATQRTYLVADIARLLSHSRELRRMRERRRRRCDATADALSKPAHMRAVLGLSPDTRRLYELWYVAADEEPSQLPGERRRQRGRGYGGRRERAAVCGACSMTFALSLGVWHFRGNSAPARLLAVLPLWRDVRMVQPQWCSGGGGGGGGAEADGEGADNGSWQDGTVRLFESRACGMLVACLYPAPRDPRLRVKAWPLDAEEAAPSACSLDAAVSLLAAEEEHDAAPMSGDGSSGGLREPSQLAFVEQASSRELDVLYSDGADLRIFTLAHGAHGGHVEMPCELCRDAGRVEDGDTRAGAERRHASRYRFERFAAGAAVVGERRQPPCRAEHHDRRASAGIFVRRMAYACMDRLLARASSGLALRHAPLFYVCRFVEPLRAGGEARVTAFLGLVLREAADTRTHRAVLVTFDEALRPRVHDVGTAARPSSCVASGSGGGIEEVALDTLLLYDRFLMRWGVVDGDEHLFAYSSELVSRDAQAGRVPAAEQWCIRRPKRASRSRVLGTVAGIERGTQHWRVVPLAQLRQHGWLLRLQSRRAPA